VYIYTYKYRYFTQDLQTVVFSADGEREAVQTAYVEVNTHLVD
jgi:hypothetical protein